MPYLPKDVLFLGQVFGALPLDYATKPRSHIVLFSPKLFKWGLFVVMTQTVFSLLALYLDFVSRNSSQPIRINNNTSLMAVLVDEATLIVLAITVLSGSSRNIPNLLELHRILARFDGSLQLTVTQSNVLWKVAAVVAFITTLLLITTVLFLDERYIFLLYIPGFTVFYTQATLFLHFTEVCFCITKRFSIINSRIRSELTKWNSTGYDNCCPGVNCVNGSTPSDAKLRILMDLYWLLCEGVHQVNLFFSTQLLASILMSFIHIIIHLFIFLTTMLNAGSDHILQCAILVLWVASQAIHMVLLMRASTLVTKSADSTVLIICDLINLKINKTLKKCMKEILLQLLHHDARFSAMGLFQISCPVLVAMTGSVTTYLVVMMQFQTQMV